MAETPASDTVWIDLDLIDFPLDVRSHTPQDVDEMANLLREQNQLQNILVLRKGDRYEVVAGARRVLGARKLEWKRIKAEIRESLSEYQRLDIIFSENEGRVEANPLYQAWLLKRMIDTGEVKNQAQLAQKKGKTEAWVSYYLGFLKLPEEVVKTLTAVKVSYRTLKDIQKLPNPDMQIQVARELQSGKIKQEGVITRCRQLKGELEKANPIKQAIPSDETSVAVQGNCPLCGASKGASRKPGEEEPFVDSPFEFSMTKTGRDVIVRTEFDRRRRVRDVVEEFQIELEKWLESKEATTDPSIWLPETPKEMAEFEALALKSPGPGPLLVKVYGPDHRYAQNVMGDTWEWRKITDPAKWARGLISTVRQFDVPSWDRRRLKVPTV